MERLHGMMSFARRVVRRFGTDACAGRAAGLAFNTLFALVPLTAGVFAVLSAVGVLQPVVAESQRVLLRELFPAASQRVFQSLAQFSENARALGIFGFGLFVLTAVALVRGVHASLNAIWRFRSVSGIWRRISTYTTVIVVGTALLALAAAAGPLVQSVVQGDAGGMPARLRSLSELLFPPALLFATLFLMTVLVPSGRVAPRSAAIGALAATIGWEVGKRVFVFWTGSVMRLSLVYGSLAAVPIFLIWLYITWLIVLMGVEVAYVHQHRDEPTDEVGGDQPAAALPELSEYTVRACAAVFIRFRDGMPPLTQHDLDERYGAATAEAIRDALVRSRLVLETNLGFLPARDPATISVNDLVNGLWAREGDESAARLLLAIWREAERRDALDALRSLFP
ncbi:MAG: YihY/virulence factor BrkB family protein [Spirochaetota bacterium]